MQQQRVFPVHIKTKFSFRSNRELIHRRGLKHVGKGVMMSMNLGRVTESGRNWEGFGADPYLAA